MIRKVLFALVALSGAFCGEADNLFYVGPTWNVSHAKLRDVGTFTGNRWGVVGGYEHFKQWGFYANLEIEWFKGTLEDDVNRFTLEQQVAFGGGRIGPVFAWDRFELVPYSGYVYHWIRETRNFTTATSNSFTYHLPFLPFGVMLHANINPQWFVGINYQYQYNYDSYLSIATLKGTLWQLQARNDNYVELEIRYRPVDVFGIRFVPFYHDFRIGATTAETVTGLQLGIPKQAYKTFGASLEFTLHF